MNWAPLLLLTLAFAGCTEESPAASEQDARQPQPACPGHFHVTLLVADGDEVWPYFDERDLVAREGGIHMHSDDGIIHIHPQQESCIALGWTLFAVEVWALERDGGAVQVGDEVRNGTVRFDIQRWGQDWETDIDALSQPIPDGARMLLMVNPPEDVSALRAQVPEIPAQYHPS